MRVEVASNDGGYRDTQLESRKIYRYVVVWHNDDAHTTPTTTYSGTPIAAHTKCSKQTLNSSHASAHNRHAAITQYNPTHQHTKQP